jgi:Cu/Ag efflux pump CusA
VIPAVAGGRQLQAEIERLGNEVEAAQRDVPGTRSAFAERAAGGYVVDLDLRRDEIARYGLSVGAVQDVVMSAIGGENVTTTVEGRARVPVNVRYPRDLRSDPETIGRVVVMTPSGARVPLDQLADIRTVTGPSMIRNENGLLVGYVYVDIVGRDVTVTAAMIGLMPIMWSIGTGADVMKRVAAPMVGGLATSFLLELLVYPPIYVLWKWHAEVRRTAEATSAGAGSGL